MRVITAFLFLILVSAQAFAQNQRHNEMTAKEGDLYIFMKVGAPISPEQLQFLSHVNNNFPNLRVLTHMQRMNEQELKLFHEEPEKYTDQYSPKADLTEREVKEYQRGTKPFSITRLEDTGVIPRYNIQKFPSLLYLTPDGVYYKYDFPPFASKLSIRAFWAAYEKHRGAGRKMWMQKQWSQ